MCTGVSLLSLVLLVDGCVLVTGEIGWEEGTAWTCVAENWARCTSSSGSS